MSEVPPALHRVLGALRCPVCAQPLAAGAASVRCPQGHTFDVARQGYLSLLAGRGVTTGDSAAMVAARAEALGRGVLDAVVAAVVAAAAPSAGELVLDIAGGTGHYLAAVLEHGPDADGLLVDASAPALRRAARAHPRAAAVGADAWAPLPLADRSVAVAMSVFGPRSADELHRVLGEQGRLVVASPAPEHLAELVAALGLVSVDPRKAERQTTTFAAFERDTVDHVRHRTELDHAAVAALVAMGPSALHVDPADLAARIAGLPDPVTTTIAVDVVRYRPRHAR